MGQAEGGGECGAPPLAATSIKEDYTATSLTIFNYNIKGIFLIWGGMMTIGPDIVVPSLPALSPNPLSCNASIVCDLIV